MFEVTFIILTQITLFQILDMDEDGLVRWDPVILQRDWNHVLGRIEDGVVKTSKLLKMALGVQDGVFNRVVF